MARLHFVKKARKDVLGYDGKVLIKAGESYFWWQFAYSRKSVSKTRPPRSHLTRSAFYACMWDLEDSITGTSFESPLELEDFRDSLVSELESLRDEQEEKRSNMPEGLQEGSTGELLQERYDEVDALIDELNCIDFDWEDADRDSDEFKEYLVAQTGYDPEDGDENLEEPPTEAQVDEIFRLWEEEHEREYIDNKVQEIADCNWSIS